MRRTTLPNESARPLPKSLVSARDAVCALLIAGDAHQLLVASSLLRELGIQVRRNTTGARVVAQIAAMPAKPDFILLDLDLPEYNPLTICADVKRQPDLAPIPVIAFGDPVWWGNRAGLEISGFSGFIAKPLPRKHLPDLLQRALDGLPVWHTTNAAATTGH